MYRLYICIYMYVYVCICLYNDATTLAYKMFPLSLFSLPASRSLCLTHAPFCPFLHILCRSSGERRLRQAEKVCKHCEPTDHDLSDPQDIRLVNRIHPHHTTGYLRLFWIDPQNNHEKHAPKTMRITTTIQPRQTRTKQAKKNIGNNYS